MEVTAYCVKEKTQRTMKDAKVVTMKNGRKAATGTCTVCGSKMFKFMSEDQVKAMGKPAKTK